MGTLYVVATPIGNLADMTPRAVETLRSVGLIAAEDTRHSATLRSAFEIDTPMISYHHHNRKQREQQLLDALSTGDVAIISDAGTPGIADPGNDLVDAALTAGYRVVPIPGTSALIATVSASGLVSGPFTFVGFLERKGDERRQMLIRAISTGWPFVLFESPNRVAETLGDIAELVGDVQAVLARELTKLHEEVTRATIRDLINAIGEDPLRGECVIVVEGQAVSSMNRAGDVRDIARMILRGGAKPSRAARELSVITGLSADDAYAIVREVGTTS